jgi:hypothetical protein
MQAMVVAMQQRDMAAAVAMVKVHMGMDITR